MADRKRQYGVQSYIKYLASKNMIPYGPLHKAMPCHAMSGTFLDAIKQHALNVDYPIYNAQCDMASERKRLLHYTLDVHFASEQEKAFTERLKAVC